MEISEFKFHGMNSVATCTDGTWSAWNTPLDASSAFTFKPGSATVTATEATDYTDNCLVIPQTFNDNVVVATFKVTATGNVLYQGYAYDVIAGVIDPSKYIVRFWRVVSFAQERWWSHRCLYRPQFGR